MLQAQVDRVGNEPKDGLIRVELALRSPQSTSIPLQHGLPGSAEVEVERVSPFAPGAGHGGPVSHERAGTNRVRCAEPCAGSRQMSMAASEDDAQG